MKGSFVALPASAVEVACSAYLEHRLRRIEKEREDMVDALMSRKLGFWASLFCFVPRSREEAVQHLKESSDGLVSSWDIPAISGGAWVHRVESLLFSARTFPDSKVNVSTTMVAHLGDFWVRS